ncbi:unnamed protein product [Lactuca saligna]|uniref:cAMP-regulated phosphoprotein 19-related protein n=1 Tax=Lactuca saligna TaxID=75948 RepID=A0AA36E2W4_LACSI|nr:unnamed protein product [Lactuca saligna]
MSETNVGSKDLNLVDNDQKVEVNNDSSSQEIPKDLEKAEDNPMPTPAQEEVVIKKKYGGLLPRKTPLISKDHDRAFFDSANWALGKPTPHQQVRSRRSFYAPADIIPSVELLAAQYNKLPCKSILQRSESLTTTNSHYLIKGYSRVN